MKPLSLDSLRRTGMTALVAMLAAVALATLAGQAVLGRDVLPALLGFAVLSAYPAWLWRSGAIDGHARMTMSMALVAAPALSLYAFTGQPWQTDLHMVFFATLAISAMLCDWRAILAATAVVAVHHLLLGMLVPGWVFYGGGGLARIIFHAVILLAEAAALLYLVQRVVVLIETVQRQAVEQQALDAAAAEERATRMAELERVTGTMGDALDRLSRYDLGHSIDREFPAAYAALRANFNAATGNLRDLVQAVRTGTVAAEDASGQIAAASDDLAARIESTAANVEEAFAALTAVRERIEQGSSVVQSTLVETVDATGHVRAGRAVTDSAVRQMQEIAASADGIDNVIEGLDKIAFQTRVLAMNAAVEAGRAGDAGRGFAVVADLVGQLAMRSEDEAKRAREQLSAIKDEMGGAVSVIAQVDHALQIIADTVDGLHRRMSSLADDHGSQAEAIRQVSLAVGEVERFVQQNAAMVEQTSAAARSLSQDFRSVTALAARFRLAEGAAPPKSAPARLPVAA